MTAVSIPRRELKLHWLRSQRFDLTFIVGIPSFAILIGLITVGTVSIVGQIGTWTAGRFTALNTALTAAS